jgi:hypothetical protein
MKEDGRFQNYNLLAAEQNFIKFDLHCQKNQEAKHPIFCINLAFEDFCSS